MQQVEIHGFKRHSLVSITICVVVLAVTWFVPMYLFIQLIILIPVSIGLLLLLALYYDRWIEYQYDGKGVAELKEKYKTTKSLRHKNIMEEIFVGVMVAQKKADLHQIPTDYKAIHPTTNTLEGINTIKAVMEQILVDRLLANNEYDQCKVKLVQ